MNKYLCNWRKANLSNNHFSSIKTMFKRAIPNIVQSEKKVTLIHFWSGIKYKLYVWCVCARVCTHSVVQSCPTLVTPWIVLTGLPLSIEFSRQENNMYFLNLFGCSKSYWRGVGSLIFVKACRIFSCGMQELVSWPEIKPGPFASRA